MIGKTSSTVIRVDIRHLPRIREYLENRQNVLVYHAKHGRVFLAVDAKEKHNLGEPLREDLREQFGTGFLAGIIRSMDDVKGEA